jgi:hypothetical protein
LLKDRHCEETGLYNRQRLIIIIRGYRATEATN